MRPDQAISQIACEAVELLEKYQAAGGRGDPQHLSNALLASVQTLMVVAGMYEKETAEPGHIEAMGPDRRKAILGEAHAAASGVLLVCSLMAEVDSLVPPVVH